MGDQACFCCFYAAIRSFRAEMVLRMYTVVKYQFFNSTRKLDLINNCRVATMAKGQFPREAFFRWLDAELEKRDWTDGKLSKVAGISASVISKARNGAQGIGWEASIAIADAIKVPREQVLRVAGFLDEPPELGPTHEEMMNLFASLSEEDQDEMIQLARIKLERKKKRGKK